MRRRPVIVAVFGKGRNAPTVLQLLAYEVGALVADAGHVLLSGALAGVMLHSARGAHAHDGVVIGLAPVEGTVDAAFPGVVLHTGLTAHVRNVVMGNACDAAIMLDGSHGAMQELAIVLDRGIPVVAVATDRWSPAVSRVEVEQLPSWLTGLLPD